MRWNRCTDAEIISILRRGDADQSVSESCADRRASRTRQRVLRKNGAHEKLSPQRMANSRVASFALFVEVAAKGQRLRELQNAHQDEGRNRRAHLINAAAG